MGKVFLTLIIGLLLLFVGMHFLRTAPLKEKDLLKAQIDQAKKDGHELSAAQEGILKIQLAIVDHMGKKGQPPNNLSELVGTYFDAVPRDPATNKPYEYSRKGNSYELAGIQGIPDASKGIPAGGTAPGVPIGKLAMKEGEDFVNPNLMPKETFVYDANGKRDPFVPFDFSARPINPGASTPLERFSLGQLRVTAVLNDPVSGPSALVEDMSGKGYTVKIGTKMGDRNGTVVAIEPDKVKILETNVDFTGKENQNVVEMKIQASADHHGKEKKSKSSSAARKKAAR
jgi:Tfp pilus assembly protein PilP